MLRALGTYRRQTTNDKAPEGIVTRQLRRLAVFATLIAAALGWEALGASDFVREVAARSTNAVRRAPIPDPAARQECVSRSRLLLLAQGSEDRCDQWGYQVRQSQRCREMNGLWWFGTDQNGKPYFTCKTEGGSFGCVWIDNRVCWQCGIT